MTTANQNPKLRNLIKHCVVCDKKLQITVHPDKTYNGGHFFGKIELDKNKKAEYWECNNCFAD